MIKEVTGIKYNSDTYTSENSIMRLMLSKPDKLNSKLTYLWGKDQDKFPLTSMTEGQGSVGIKEINDVQYYWDIMGRMKYTDEVVSYDNSVNTTPGIGGAIFYVVFKSNWFISQYGLVAPDGTRYRIMEEPTRVSGGTGYRYTLQSKTTDVTASCATSNLIAGKTWTMSAPTVPESMSRGNRTNVVGPGKLTNQISFTRYTKKIAGNAANKVCEIEFDNASGGGTTKLWMNEEMRQFELSIRELNEEHLWTSEYNRTTNGDILLKDLETGLPIPEGAGMFELVKSSNYDTYGYNLTEAKIRNTITDVFTGDTDTGTMEIVLYCGRGFMEDFDYAFKDASNSNSFFTPLGEKVISGGANLQYGKYFTQYKTIEGHLVTLKHLRILDYGTKAQMDRKNGNLHPRSGHPIESHKALFIDHSSYNGERNVKMVNMMGQSAITGIYKGMSPLPSSWGAMPEKSIISTDQDIATYEKKFSKGINIDNTEHCFYLECRL